MRDYSKIIFVKAASLIRAHYYRFVPGVVVLLLLFFASMAMNMSISYMGNTNDALAGEIIRQFWGTILLQILKVVVVYALIGAIISAVFFGAVSSIARRLAVSPSRRKISLVAGCFVLLYSLLLFLSKLILNPQLYIENFAAHAKSFESFQFFLTGHLSPLVFSLPAWLMIGAALIIIAVDLFTRELVMSLWRRLLSLRYRNFVAVGVFACAVIVFLYECNYIFYRPAARPNILVIASDAIRPDHFGVNGYRRDTTPRIDAIARRSAQFRGVMTAVPRTFPSWVSILTSQYPLTHNIKHMFPRSRERTVRFDSACNTLNGLGYRTAVVSDFAGDIFPRIDLGFGKVLAPDMNFPILVKQIILEKQTFLFPFITNRIGALLFPEIRGIAKYSQHGQVTDETIDLIESARGNPFFITVFYSITHFPFAAPYPYYSRYAESNYRGPYKYYKQVVIQMAGGSARAHEDSQADRDQVVALYDGCLSLFDREVGRLFDYLKHRGMLDNTIVVITSDHGENLYDRDLGMGHGEHLRGYPALEVPLIIHFPKIADEQKTTHTGIFSTIDIMPTVFDLAGIARPVTFHGRSLFSKGSSSAEGRVDAYSETGLWFDNNKQSSLFFQHARIDYPDVTGISELDPGYHREIVIQQRYQNITNAAKYRAIFSGGYKLIYMPLPAGPRFELYDQMRDPLNEHDLALSRGDLVGKMKKRLFDFVDEKSNGNFIVNRDFLFPVFSDPVF